MTSRLLVVAACLVQCASFTAPALGVGRARAARLAPSSTRCPTCAAAAAHGPRGARPPTALWASEGDTAGGTEVSYQEALTRAGGLTAIAALFGASVWYVAGEEAGLEWFAGYLVEQSLSVDNLFVFILLFEFFKVPNDLQTRVLNWGIYGAMVMRGIMVALGAATISRYHEVLLVFAGILLYSSFQLLTEDEEEDEDLEGNNIVKFANKLVDASDTYDGERFFSSVTGQATPLLLCLVCIELSDVVFAVDSVPAVFGVTEDPLIVYTSNLFAIFGLRAWYFVLANAVNDLPLLKPAVALVLGFVGSKMSVQYFGYEVDTLTSLGIIVAILGGGAVGSLMMRGDDAEDGAA